MANDSMDRVFSALGSRTRRKILDVLKSRPGLSVNEVCEYFDTSRIAVMKQLRILEDAGLVHSEKKGRVRSHYHNPVPIQMIYDRWTTEYSAVWAGHLTRVKYRVESKRKK